MSCSAERREAQAGVHGGELLPYIQGQNGDVELSLNICLVPDAIFLNVLTNLGSLRCGLAWDWEYVRGNYHFVECTLFPIENVFL